MGGHLVVLWNARDTEIPTRPQFVLLAVYGHETPRIGRDDRPGTAGVLADAVEPRSNTERAIPNESLIAVLTRLAVVQIQEDSNAWASVREYTLSYLPATG